MIPELGNFSLVLALSLAVLLSVVPMIGVHRNSELLMTLSRPLKKFFHRLVSGDYREVN